MAKALIEPVDGAEQSTSPRPARRHSASGRQVPMARTRRASTTITVDADAAGAYNAHASVVRVVDVLGNNVVADLLGIARSQPSRWKSGQEQPSADSRKRIVDLDYILDRLLLELYPDQIGMWLTSPNPHLNGSAPVDMLKLRGAAGVLPAIDALAAGAFA